MFHDLLAKSEADTGSRVFLASIEPLKDHEYALDVSRVKPDAIIPDTKEHLVLSGSGANRNFRRSFAAVFDGIADQVLEELDELGVVCLQGRKRIAVNPCFAFFNGDSQVGKDNIDNIAQICRLELLTSRINTGEQQEVFD